MDRWIKKGMKDETMQWNLRSTYSINRWRDKNLSTWFLFFFLFSFYPCQVGGWGKTSTTTKQEKHETNINKSNIKKPPKFQPSVGFKWQLSLAHLSGVGAVLLTAHSYGSSLNSSLAPSLRPGEGSICVSKISTTTKTKQSGKKKSVSVTSVCYLSEMF